MTGLQKPKKIL